MSPAGLRSAPPCGFIVLYSLTTLKLFKVILKIGGQGVDGREWLQRKPVAKVSGGNKRLRGYS